MVTLPEKPDPRAVEEAARTLWAAQHLPPTSGPVGPADGPVVHQFEGAFAPQEAGMLSVQRAVAADVDARAMILVGRRAQGLLRKEEGGPPTPTPPLEPLLKALGVWVGGADGRNWENAPRREQVQSIVGRLAQMGAIAVRDVSLRICPACAMARSPERIVYQEEDGDALLVRFPFQDGDRMVSGLVWTDAPWRLLGTSALMVHPDIPYVIARYRRRGAEEFLFISKAALDRIRDWLPGAELEILEEHPGRHWEGRTYIHPLRHEFPMGGSMEPPAGTILPVADVSESGTGVVPLVPGHGGTDTQIADRLNVPGWPLITPRGRFDILFVHKYAGLELESGSGFVERDLAEGGAIFARLRVRRGVPHCSRCGTAVIWAPGRAWCLEPSRLPQEKVAIYHALLPHDRAIEKLEAVPWPVSEPQRSDDPLAITLLECSSCDRLEPAGAEGRRCACGVRRHPLRRRLLPAFDAAVAVWASVDPFPPADTVRIYVNERRRAPAVVHHIAAMSGVGVVGGEVRLTVLPTVPEVDLGELIATRGADAVRAALVRGQSSEGATSTFPERCLQEALRLEAFWRGAREILARVDGPGLSSYSQPLDGSIGSLEPEDRALLARFERMRIQCIVDFDRSAPGLVHRRLFQFLENDFTNYREWVLPRLAAEGNPVSKRAALHTLVHVLSQTTQLLGPIVPHLAEVVHRALRRDRASLFEEAPVGVDRTLIDDNRVQRWDRWLSIVRALERLRRQAGLSPRSLLPSVALVVDTDAAADEYRADGPTIERLARIRKVEVGSPGTPWSGRRRQLRPRESEIQRVYANRQAQIIHLLRRMPERKWTDPGTGEGFTMIVNGQPTQILPSMIEWEETLPDHVIPVEWSGGELYAELPPGARRTAVAPPPLSRDGFRVVRRVAHRLRAVPPGTAPVVIVAASGALAPELAGLSESIAKYLGVREFRVVPYDKELPHHDLGFGRTRAGAPWSFHIAGLLPSVPRSKHRPGRAHGVRVRPAFAPSELAPTVIDYTDPQILAREAEVRALGGALDDLLGAPLLGPAKVGHAWDAGLRNLDAFRQAPWTTVAALPGFGTAVATVLLTKLGGTVPVPAARPARRAPAVRSPPGSAEIPAVTREGFDPGPRGEWAPSVPRGVPSPAPPSPQVGAAAVAPPLPRDVPVEPSPAPTPEVGSPSASRERPVASPETTAIMRTPAEQRVSIPSRLPVLEELARAAASVPWPMPGVDPAVPSPPEPGPSGGRQTDEGTPTAPMSPAQLPPDPGESRPPNDGATPAQDLERGPPPLPTSPALPQSGSVPTIPEARPVLGSLPEPEGTPPPDVAAHPALEWVPAAEPLPPTEAAAAPAASAPAEGTAFPFPAVEPSAPEAPSPIEVPAEPTPIPPPTGGIELSVGPSYIPSLERFLEATAAGHLGVCIVRDAPERIRPYIGSRPVEIRWLTNTGRGPALKPADLEGFAAFLTHAVTTGLVTAFFLEGVEYLIRLHGLDRVVDQMAEFHRRAREHSARVWMPLNPKLLSESELHRFVETFPASGEPT